MGKKHSEAENNKFANIAMDLQLYNSLSMVSGFAKERKIPGIQETDYPRLESMCDSAMSEINKKHKYDFFIHAN